MSSGIKLDEQKLSIDQAIQLVGSGARKSKMYQAELGGSIFLQVLTGFEPYDKEFPDWEGFHISASVRYKKGNEVARDLNESEKRFPRGYFAQDDKPWEEHSINGLWHLFEINRQNSEYLALINKENV